MRINGAFPLITTNSNETLGLTNLLGLQTGLARLALSSNTFVPGAMADSLTSYGGCLFETTGQTNLLAFLRAGATASYGTVVEPCNYEEKFPEPRVYFYQARGFSIAECYYQSLASPYQGLVVGEPLAAPFALAGQGAWIFEGSQGRQGTPHEPDPSPRPSPIRWERVAKPGEGFANRFMLTEQSKKEQPPPPDPPVLAGNTNLSVRFLAADETRPLQQVDLFVNGTLAFTATNVPPCAGNVVSVWIDQAKLDLPVLPGASLESLGIDLAMRLNADSDATGVGAKRGGDRVGVSLLTPGRPVSELSFAAASSQGSGTALTTFVRQSPSGFVDSTARPYRSYVISGTSAEGDVLRCTLIKTNGESISIAVTNQAPPVDTGKLALRLLNQINTSPSLQGADGVSAEDVYTPSDRVVSFILYARSLGLAAARLRCEWELPSHITVDPSTPQNMDENAPDLSPRNHLSLTVGCTNLAVAFPFDTSGYPDGLHELTAVAYEGSSLRTQTRATTVARIRNSTLEATLRCSLDSPVVAVGTTLPFEVVPNRPAIERIDLFGTGGWLASVTNAATASFALPGTEFGPGRHVFHALVVASDGARYRTDPCEIRLIDQEIPIRVAISSRPLALSWPTTSGRTYDVLSGQTADTVGHLEATVSASDTGTTVWVIPEPSLTTRFYRIRIR